MAKMRKYALGVRVSGGGGDVGEAAAVVLTRKRCSSNSLTAETPKTTVGIHDVAAKQSGAGSATPTSHQFGLSINIGHGRNHGGMVVVAAAALGDELTARSSRGAAAPPSNGGTDLGAVLSGATAPHEAFQRGGGIDHAAVLPV